MDENGHDLNWTPEPRKPVTAVLLTLATAAWWKR